MYICHCSFNRNLLKIKIRHKNNNFEGGMVKDVIEQSVLNNANLICDLKKRRRRRKRRSSSSSFYLVSKLDAPNREDM